jgi:hypothetical protein
MWMASEETVNVLDSNTCSHLDVSWIPGEGEGVGLDLRAVMPNMAA